MTALNEVINLKGLLMGNPFTSLENDGIVSTLRMLAAHAVISPESVSSI